MNGKYMWMNCNETKLERLSQDAERGREKELNGLPWNWILEILIKYYLFH